MKIQYNALDKSIEIKDGRKKQYFIIIFLMILNIFSAVLYLFIRNDEQLGLILYFWVVIGILSFGVFMYYVFKKTVVSKIPVVEINQLQEKILLGRKTFSLQLKNGKLRDLTELKTKAEILELKKLFDEIGIENS